MNHIIGIGGIFFKAQNPTQLSAWYREHLGIEVGTGDSATFAAFKWHALDQPDQVQSTIWSVFPHDTSYFEPGKASFMINYIVDDLDKTLADLRSSGVQVDDKIEEADFGRFGWATDPDGNRFELWEPPHSK